MTRVVLLVGLALSLVSLTVRAERRSPATDEARDLLRQAQQLQYRMDAVASGQGRVRYLQGGVFLASVGFLYGTYLAVDRFTSGDVEVIAKGVVGTTGAVFASAGLFTLLFPGEAEGAGDRFRAISARNLGQLRAKVDQGEAELRRLAERARVSNNIIGGAMLAVGVADLVWFLGTGPNYNLNFLAYLGGLYSALGLSMMLIDTPAEAEWEEYRDSRRSASQQKSAWLRGGAKFAVVPQPGGATLGLSLRF